MSIVWVRQKLASPESIDSDHTPEAQTTKRVAKWMVLTDAITDGPDTVKAAAGLPQPFATYSFGTETDENAYAVHINARRNRQKPLLWDVTIEYINIPAASGSPGEGSVDVTAYLPEINITEGTFTEALTTAYREGYRDAVTWDYAQAHAAGKKNVVNSAGLPYERTVEITKHFTQVEITQNLWTYNFSEARRYRDHVNSVAGWGYDRGDILCFSVRGKLKTIQNYLFWARTCIFGCREEGWGTPLLDQGYIRYCQADGTASTSSPSTREGRCLIKDTMGQPVTRPVLLDGDGNQLAVAGTPVWTTWHGYDEIDFDGLNLPDLSNYAITFFP